jgi:hypothetical protein
MMKNVNISLLDQEQMSRQEHDALHDAKRVIIVGGDGAQIADSIKESLKNLKMNGSEQPNTVYIPDIRVLEVPKIIKEIEFKEIEKPVVVTELKIVEIERPTVVTELRIVEIEKPIFLPQIEIIEVEKPIIVKELEPISMHLKILLVAQTLALIARFVLDIIHFK